MVMKKSLLISKVAALAREMESLYDQRDTNVGSLRYFKGSQEYQDLLGEDTEEEGSTVAPTLKMRSAIADLKEMDGGDGKFVGCDLTESMRIQLEQALGAWEEPELVEKRNVSC